MFKYCKFVIPKTNLQTSYLNKYHKYLDLNLASWCSSGRQGKMVTKLKYDSDLDGVGDRRHNQDPGTCSV